MNPTDQQDQELDDRIRALPPPVLKRDLVAAALQNRPTTNHVWLRPAVAASVAFITLTLTLWMLPGPTTSDVPPWRPAYADWNVSSAKPAGTFSFQTASNVTDSPAFLSRVRSAQSKAQALRTRFAPPLSEEK